MSLVESLLQAALSATDESKRQALDVLRGVQRGPAPSPLREAPEEYLTQRACAKKLGFSASQIWRWRCPTRSLGGRPRYKVSEVEAYFKTDAFKRRVAELKDERKERSLQSKPSTSAQTQRGGN